MQLFFPPMEMYYGGDAPWRFDEKLAGGGVAMDTGSHYLTHAEWGCSDGVHKAWMIVETETREQALGIVPPFMRPDAQVIELKKFFTDEMGEILISHGEE